MQLRGVMGSHCLKVIAQTQTYLVYSLANATHTHSTCPIVGKFYLVDVGYACRPGFLPPYRGVRYHLSEYGPRNRPNNAKELFNLRHSSLRVTVERAIGALKLRFRIFDNKPFHKYRTQVKLVVACAILHNWILGFGMDEVVPNEADFTGAPPQPVELPPAHLDVDSIDMAAKRDVVCEAMWAGRGNNRV
jgi:hypothetical protein